MIHTILMMRKLLVNRCLMFLCMVLLVCISVEAQEQLFSENELIVQLKKDRSLKDLDAQRASIPSPIVMRSLTSDQSVYLLQFEGDANIDAAMQQLRRSDAVHHVQRNRILKSRSRITPDDPFFEQQWNLQRIGAPTIWDQSTGGVTPCGDTIVIAIFDSGLDPAHPDVSNQLWTNPGEIANNSFDDDGNGYTDDHAGLNLDTGNDKHPIATDYHGTSVASVIGATSNNGLGIAGLNWEVKLLIISSAEKTEATVMEAFNYVIALRRQYNESNGAEGAFVVAINNSWGIEGFFEEDFPMLCDMFNELGEVGILGVGATENDQVNTDVFGDIPSDCSSDHLIVVTNTDQADELSVAGFGRENVDLGAPGEGIFGADADSDYRTYGGTSYAAPHVTGAIGLLYALSEVTFCDIARVSPSEAALLVKRFLLDGVTPIISLEDRTVSGGRLNLAGTYDLVTGTRNRKPAEFTIYPNPTWSQSIIRSGDQQSIRRILVTDMLGRQIWSLNSTASPHQVRINTSEWISGLYLVQLFTEHGSGSSLLIKQ